MAATQSPSLSRASPLAFQASAEAGAGADARPVSAPAERRRARSTS